MIRYSLVCERGHAFDAWFASAAAYDATEKAGANACPQCGSDEVTKAIMAPSVSAQTRHGASATDTGNAGGREAGKDAGKVDMVAADPRRAALRKAMNELRRKVVESADYVGDKFPEEARKIHYQEVEPRGIYGEASPEEARDLIEEGVEVMPLPPAPEEKN